jgi:hypothetical protein
VVIAMSMPATDSPRAITGDQCTQQLKDHRIYAQLAHQTRQGLSCIHHPILSHLPWCRLELNAREGRHGSPPWSSSAGRPARLAKKCRALLACCVGLHQVPSPIAPPRRLLRSLLWVTGVLACIYRRKKGLKSPHL